MGVDRVQSERVRASLRGGPLHIRCPGEAPDDGDPDIVVASVDDMEEALAGAAPVIAFGPAGLLRAAFLAGCADYLRDPWTPEELALRTRAALSRRKESWRFPWGSVSFAPGSLVVPAGTVALTHAEMRILRILLHNRGAPLPRDALQYAVTGRSAGRGRSVDVHISALRRKVRRLEPRCGRFIESVRGQGYLIP
ncbi:MAG TPA: winged helix-turn-helix domain-containing protein [Spirochaetia bacterium]|nr:winged helix-turn-helix domain-containing protein [Spirochaetia bacterium]